MSFNERERCTVELNSLDACVPIDLLHSTRRWRETSINANDRLFAYKRAQMSKRVITCAQQSHRSFLLILFLYTYTFQSAANLQNESLRNIHIHIVISLFLSFTSSFRLVLFLLFFYYFLLFLHFDGIHILFCFFLFTSYSVFLLFCFAFTRSVSLILVGAIYPRVMTDFGNQTRPAKTKRDFSENDISIRVLV